MRRGGKYNSYTDLIAVQNSLAYWAKAAWIAGIHQVMHLHMLLSVTPDSVFLRVVGQEIAFC